MYVTTGSLAGTVDVAATAVITENVGGPGIHAFNEAHQTGVRTRASFFVSQESSTTSTFEIYLQTYPGDAEGGHMAVAIYDTSGVLVTSSAVTLSNAGTVASLSTATTPSNEFTARLTNDPALGADANQRCLVGAQRVFSDASTGLYAPGYSMVLLEGGPWYGNLENYNYSNGTQWTYTTGRGREVSGFAYLLLQASNSFAIEMGGNGFATIGPAYTGITAILNGVTVQDHKLIVDTQLRHYTITLPGTPTTVQLIALGRNGRSSAFEGTLYSKIFYRTGDPFFIHNAAYEENCMDTVGALGDSISDGFEADPMAQYGWMSPFTLGAATGRPVACDAAGGETTFRLRGTAATNEEIDKLNRLTPSSLLIGYGTNDWQHEGTSPSITLANFQADLQAFADRFHATNPGTCLLNGIWFKPSFEGTLNTDSHTLDDFRDAIIAVLANEGNPSWLRVVMTKPWLISTGPGTTDDFVGGSIHPNNAGSTKIAAKMVSNLASSKMTITPASLTLAAGSAMTLSASGGVPPYFWLMQYANPTASHVNGATGRLTAGNAGTDFVYATDSVGQVATMALTVTSTVVTISGPSAVTTGDVTAYSASGGVPPYTWSLGQNLSGGSIVPSTGVATAGTTGNYNNQTVDVIHVVDSLGSAADFDVIVTKPFAPPAGTTLWIKGQTGITPTSLTRRVSAQADQSGQGNNLSQTSSIHYPFQDPVGVNGFPAIQYYYSYQTAFSTGHTLGTFITQTQRCIFAVVSLQTATGTALSGNMAEQNDSIFGDSSGYFEMEFVNDSGVLRAMVNDYSGVDNTLISTQAITPYTPTMVTSRKSSNVQHLQVNQTAEVSAPCPATHSSGMSVTAYVGSGFAQVRGITGVLVELIVLNNDPGGSEIARTQAYLIEKYNL